MIVPAGDHAVLFEILPTFDRMASVTSVTATMATERQFLGGQLLVEVSVGRHAQSVRERPGRPESLRRGYSIISPGRCVSRGFPT